MYKRVLLSMVIGMMLVPGASNANIWDWISNTVSSTSQVVSKAMKDFGDGLNAFKQDVNSTAAKSYFWAYDTGKNAIDWTRDTSLSVAQHYSPLFGQVVNVCPAVIHDNGLKASVSYNLAKFQLDPVSCTQTGRKKSSPVALSSGSPSNLDGYLQAIGKADICDIPSLPPFDVNISIPVNIPGIPSNVSIPSNDIISTIESPLPLHYQGALYLAGVDLPRDPKRNLKLIKPACYANIQCVASTPQGASATDQAAWVSKCDAELFANLVDIRGNFLATYSPSKMTAILMANRLRLYADLGLPKVEDWAVANSDPTTPPADVGVPVFRQAADVNGDGKDEYCRQIGHEIVCGSYDAATRDWTEVARIGGDLGYMGNRWFADVDGDGKDDFCRQVGNPGATIIVCERNVNNAWKDFAYFYGDIGYEGNRWFADVNGDGKDEYCRETGNRTQVGSGVSNFVCSEYVNNTWQDMAWFHGDFGYESNRWYADVNGDGKADYCRGVGVSSMTAIACSISTGSGFNGGQVNVPVGTDLGYPDARWFADVNGDGKADYCREVGNRDGSSNILCKISTGNAFTADAFSISATSDIGFRHPRMFADFTGDGRMDYLRTIGLANNRKLTVLELHSNEPPVADAGASKTAECSGGTTASVTLNGSGSSDPDNDPLTYSWSWAGGSATGVNPTASFPLGTTNVTLTVDDGNGKTSSATTTVTVQDTTAPAVNAGPSVTLEATSTSGASYDVAAQASVTDNCCAATPSIAPAGPYPLGSTTVTVSGTDCSNNTAIATMVVTVQDTTPPVVAIPADVTAEANAVTSTVDIGAATATDIFAVAITSDAPATYSLGTTLVTWTAVDANGNSSTGTQNVTVQDTTPPVLSGPADVTAEANAVTSTVDIGAATATDIFAVAITSDAPATYSLGTTLVTWTAVDANGNSTTGTQNVTVRDTTVPVLSVPADVSVEASGTQTPVPIGNATATDIFAVTITSDAPATYPLGTTLVTWTAVDANGNSTTGTQNVTVVDTTAPTVTAQLVPVVVGDDDDHHGKKEEHAKKGLFQVVFTASDIVDANPALTATLNGATVTDGQIVKLKRSKKSEAEFEHGMLKVEGMVFTLDVSATDFSGNTGTAQASFAFPPHHDRDTSAHRGNDREDRHADSGMHKSEGKAKTSHKKGHRRG